MKNKISFTSFLCCSKCYNDIDIHPNWGNFHVSTSIHFVAMETTLICVKKCLCANTFSHICAQDRKPCRMESESLFVPLCNDET